MEAATYHLAWNRKNLKLKPGDQSLVQIIVYFNKRRKIITTGIYLEKGQWSEENQLVKKHTNQVELNRTLRNLVDNLQRFEYSVKNSGRQYGIGLLEEYLKGREGITNFIEYVEDDIKTRTDIEETTRRAHLVAIGRLSKSGIVKNFMDLSFDNILAFDNWLRSKKYDQSTIQDTHKRVSSYIKRIVRKEMLTRDLDPYLRFKIKGAGTSDRKYLSQEDLAQIENKVFETERLNVVRDLFIFSCYTGVAWGDICKLTRDNLVQVDGETILRLRRSKTDEKASVLLLDKAKAIIEKYKDSPDGKLLPLRSNQKFNEYLHEIETLLGIRTKLTTHVARHTFATTVLLMNGVSLESTQKMLGHKSIKTTEIYGKIVERRIIDEMKQLRTKMNGETPEKHPRNTRIPRKGRERKGRERKG
jgi:site-specific recombinase XerD